MKWVLWIRLILVLPGSLPLPPRPRLPPCLYFHRHPIFLTLSNGRRVTKTSVQGLNYHSEQWCLLVARPSLVYHLSKASRFQRKQLEMITMVIIKPSHEKYMPVSLNFSACRAKADSYLFIFTSRARWCNSMSTCNLKSACWAFVSFLPLPHAPSSMTVTCCTAVIKHVFNPPPLIFPWVQALCKEFWEELF